MSNSRDERIGENVRRFREGSALSQADLAERMRESGHDKWSQSTVWSVEKGTRPLRLTESEDLARILGLEDSRELSMGWHDAQILSAQLQVVDSYSTFLERAGTVVFYRHALEFALRMEETLQAETGEQLLSPSRRAFAERVLQNFTLERAIEKAESEGKEQYERWLRENHPDLLEQEPEDG